MRVFGYSELEKAPRGSVIALGFFDGVHKAHRDILYSAYSEAKRLGVPKSEIYDLMIDNRDDV